MKIYLVLPLLAVAATFAPAQVPELFLIGSVPDSGAMICDRHGLVLTGADSADALRYSYPGRDLAPGPRQGFPDNCDRGTRITLTVDSHIQSTVLHVPSRVSPGSAAVSMPKKEVVL